MYTWPSVVQAGAVLQDSSALLLQICTTAALLPQLSLSQSKPIIRSSVEPSNLEGRLLLVHTHPLPLFIGAAVFKRRQLIVVGGQAAVRHGHRCKAIVVVDCRALLRLRDDGRCRRRLLLH